VKARTDKPEPTLTRSQTDKPIGKFREPYREQLDPALQYPLTLREEPKDAKSNTDIDFRFATDRMESADPRLTNWKIEKLDPKSVRSLIDKDPALITVWPTSRSYNDPKRKRPRIETHDPNLENPRKLKLDPAWR
jgi:hypothetical protein